MWNKNTDLHKAFLQVLQEADPDDASVDPMIPEFASHLVKFTEAWATRSEGLDDYERWLSEWVKSHTYTFEELRHKTVGDLREIAKGTNHEAVQGYTQMNKEHLLLALSKALGIQHEHHDVVGIDKASIKARIRQLKTQREAALAAHDHARLKMVRRTMHRLKRRIHKATV